MAALLLYKGAQIWNSLPENVQKVDSINQFVKHVKPMYAVFENVLDVWWTELMKRFDVYYIDVCENVFVHTFIIVNVTFPSHLQTLMALFPKSKVLKGLVSRNPVTSEDQGLPEYVQGKKEKKKGF